MTPAALKRSGTFLGADPVPDTPVGTSHKERAALARTSSPLRKPPDTRQKAAKFRGWSSPQRVTTEVADVAPRPPRQGPNRKEIVGKM